MPKKKKQDKIKSDAIVAKSLFDHINQLTSIKKSNYWENLSEADIKTFSTFMINRFLSMDYDYIELVNILQQFTIGILDAKTSYKLYMDLIPKRKVYLKYMKGKSNDNVALEVIDYVAKYFEVSKTEAKSYINIFLNKYGGKKELIDILSGYGIEEKKINKMLNYKKEK